MMHIATQLLLADGLSSYYVSANSVAIDWCHDPMEITTGEAGKPMLCNKSGSSISCTFTYGGICTWDNNIYYGPLVNVGSYQYTGGVCNIGKSGTANFTLPDGDYFWVVVSWALWGFKAHSSDDLADDFHQVGNIYDYAHEGSYGRDSNGNFRPESSFCYNMPQSFINACGTQ